ncbi:MAG: glutathione S-transferase N-terminal domain-containing protein [Pseudomonadota bacterium]
MNPSGQLILYFWPTHNGFKISIALEELELPYTLRLIDIDHSEQFAPEFLAIAPNNKMPVLIDPSGSDGKPITIFESAAILLYLGRKCGALIGTTERERSEVEQWLIWQVANVGPMLGQIHHFVSFAPEKISYAIERYRKEGTRLYGVLDRQLAGREFVAGEYSVADIAIFPWTRPWRIHGVLTGQFPNWERWFATMNARSAVRRGLAAGGEVTARLEAARSKQRAALAILAGDVPSVLRGEIVGE